MNTANPTSPRVDWVDYAKGICILWVVTMYATDYVKEVTGSIGWMQPVVDFAQPFRMPDFFLLSGLFVARVLDRPLRDYIDSKVVHFLYFYLLWATLKFVNLHGRALVGPGALDLLPDYLMMLVEPPTGPLWFIHSLALFFIAVRLLRRVPAVVVLLGAAALQVAVTWGPDVHWSIKAADKFARYFVFFYAGYLAAPHVFSAAAWARLHRGAALLIFAAWAVVNEALVLGGMSFLPGMQLVLGFAGAGGVMLFATMIARSRHAGWLRYLGQNSIVVFLGFVIPLGLLRRLVHNPPAGLDLGTLAFVVMALSVLGALLLYWAVRPTPLRFLFERPKWTHLRREKPPAALKPDPIGSAAP